MTTNRPEFKAHDDFIFEHKEVGKVTREEFIKYIRSSHEHMRKLSQIIQQYNQTIDEYLNEWDGNLESFDDDVKDLLGQWIQDGTMDHIINENLMSTKADKSYVDDLNENVTAQLAQTAVDAKIGRGSSRGGANIVLDIPTYDGHPTATHPDVVYIPKGWNGYTHWMAFTPYPDGGRENPSIIASNNGVDWEVPDGLTNPLKTYADARALNFSFWSDTDLVLLPNDDLAVYFRGHSSTKEGIYRMTSSDGINWGDFTLVLEAPSTTGNVVLSPAIVVEEDGTFTMFSINHEKNGVNKLEKRTSENGVDWSLAIQCFLPAGYEAWHVDVVKVEGVYHALISSVYANADGRLYYSSSSDGINFVGDSKPSIPLSGYGDDANGHYRSSLVPIAGNPLSFKIYVSSWWPSLAPTSEGWRILYYDDVVLENNTFRSIKKVDDVVHDHERIFIPATDFYPTLGSATKKFTGIGQFYWDMKVSDRVAAPLTLPKDWNTMRMFVLASNVSGNPGITLLETEVVLRLPGEDITTPSGRFYRSGASHGRLTLGNVGELVKSFCWGQRLSFANLQRYENIERLSFVRVSRLEADNTFTGELAFLGVVLERLDDNAKRINTPPS